MYLPIKFICKKSKARKDGTSLIFIQYCYSGEQRILISTGVAIPPEYWNKKSQKISPNLPTVYGVVRSLTETLTKKLRIAEDIVSYACKNKSLCPLTFLKENFDNPNWDISTKQVIISQNNLDVFYQIDDYIKSKHSMVVPASLNVMKAMKQRLLSFQEYKKTPITFDSFDITFYTDFVRYLTYDIPHLQSKRGLKGLKVNTIGKTIKTLKGFLKDRMKRKIIPHFDLSDYKGMEENVDAVYLSWNELSLLYHLDLSGHQHLERYRDLLVLGCLTGFRFSDYSDIKPEEVRDDMLYVTQQKTGDRVVVPLQQNAKNILIEKYKMQMPQVSNPEFNLHIKEVCRLANFTELIKFVHKKGNGIISEIKPKYAWVTSHTCRRSFCTNEFLAGTPVDLIMAISGHKTEKDFRKYIKADKLQKANMIKNLWSNRPML